MLITPLLSYQKGNRNSTPASTTPGTPDQGWGGRMRLGALCKVSGKEWDRWANKGGGKKCRWVLKARVSFQGGGEAWCRIASGVSLLHLLRHSWQFWQRHLGGKAHYSAHMVERILCISWMHAVLHTHSVLSPGPAVLQTLANWETFCAVKTRTGEARLWLIRCDTSQKSQSNKKLRRVLHTHRNKGSSARQGGTRSQHLSHFPSSCGFRPNGWASLPHTWCPLGNLCLYPLPISFLECLKFIWTK